MDAAFPTFGRRPFEMFDDIRDIDLSAVDSSLQQRLIEKLSRRSDKRVSHAIFLVPQAARPRA